MNTFASTLFACLIFCISGCDRAATAVLSFDTPDDPLATFELEEGFQIELVASEPLVADPVAMEVDESGLVFVLEMPGYPLDVNPTGRVRTLRDTDGDGVLDESTVFADGFILPTGLMRWKEGLLVTAPPDVFYVADTDEDGTADHREVVLTGFARSNPQHNFNKPLYGLDNWIYLANNGTIGTTDYAAQFGDSGEEVHYFARPDGARLGRNANGRNVRFKPDSFELESLAGRSQFGHTFDAWGHHFSLDNSHPQYHEVIAARYLERNPNLSPRMAMHYTPIYGRNAAIYPITLNPEHQLLTDRGMITSASGITYYLGGLFPDEYRDISIVGESVHNLVHVLRVEEKGPTFEATRLEPRKEFLASTDSWFRPVNFYVGPDGALYVIDYYRQIVEHPEWMDEETARSGKLKNGTEMGRIYRISPDGTEPAGWMNRLALGDAHVDSLALYLASNNIWWRRTAQRLLVDRKDSESVEVLEQIAASNDAPEGRLHALWTLQGIGELKAAHVRSAFQDPHPGVRENAIVLAEFFMADSPEIRTALYGLESDSHPRVRFQLLCTLGLLDTPESQAIQKHLLIDDIDDEWMQLAALSSASNIDATYLSDLLPTLTSAETNGRKVFIQRLASMSTANGTPGDLNRLRSYVMSQPALKWWQLAILQGMAEGVRRANLSVRASADLRNQALAAFTSSVESAPRKGYLALLKMLPRTRDDAANIAIATSRQIANSDEALPEIRAQAVELMAHLAPIDHLDDFRQLISPAQPQEVQLAAVRASGSDPAITGFFVESWPSMSPAVRDAALDQMMRSKDGMEALLEAVGANQIQVSAIGWDRTVRLMRDTEGALRDRARELLSEPPGVREQAVETYYSSLDLDGNTASGREVFEKNCGLCHRVAGQYGTDFGPDLSTVRHWSARALLAKILIPQRTVADGFSLWAVEGVDGKTATGLLVSESPTSITLRQQGQPDVTFPRSEVESLRSLNASAMPAGLEAQISKQEMADLIAFLRFN